MKALEYLKLGLIEETIHGDYLFEGDLFESLEEIEDKILADEAEIESWERGEV